MKFLVITKHDGKRRVAEHEFSTIEELHATLAKTTSESYRVFCEIDDLVNSLSSRVTSLEQRLESLPASQPTPHPAVAPCGKNESMTKNSEFVIVELLEKHLIPENYELGIHEDRIEFELRFNNISSKRIRAVKGDLVFLDLFDSEVFRIGITMNESMDQGGRANWSGGFAYNPYIAEHVHFAGFKAEDLKLALENEQVIT